MIYWTYKMAKLKEVTVEDIGEKYIREVFEKTLINAINIINARLIKNFRYMVEQRALKILITELNLGSLSLDVRKDLVDQLDEFYTTWSIYLQGIGGHFYVVVEPDVDFNITTNVALLKVERQELQKDSNEEINNRADILDL